ncbi:MAG: prepilin peptidase [Nitrospirales bacterium]|nr:prepilin peptidase [Nitrospirales bacterium]
MFLLFGYVSVFFFGLIIGSFLNVCIHRIPREQSIVWPRSACPLCATTLAWKDNIPLVSFFLLRGRCRQCRMPIAFRYPFVELSNGLGYVATLWTFGMTGSTVLYSLFLSILLTITWIDIGHYIIPDSLSLPGLSLGLMGAATVLPIEFLDAVFGVVLGGGVLWIVVVLSPYLFGKEGMGRGDIKLLAMIGAFLGWESVLMTLMLAAIVGSLIGMGLILGKFMNRGQYMPFGPFLALGAVCSLFFHTQIIDWYLQIVW